MLVQFSMTFCISTFGLFLNLVLACTLGGLMDAKAFLCRKMRVNLYDLIAEGTGKYFLHVFIILGALMGLYGVMISTVKYRAVLALDGHIILLSACGLLAMSTYFMIIQI